MRRWAEKELGGECEAGPDTGASEVEVVGRRLVEVEVWDGLGLGGVEGRCLIEEPGEEIALGRSARGREGWGFVREVDVEEDGGDDGRIGQKREDPHVGAAGGTQERQHVVDASEQDGHRIRAGEARSGAGSEARPVRWNPLRPSAPRAARGPRREAAAWHSEPGPRGSDDDARAAAEQTSTGRRGARGA
jgi:hypothetical protein